jgi:hypothetical protein
MHAKSGRGVKQRKPKLCPIAADSLTVAELSHDIVWALRRLRRDLRLCRPCIRDASACPLRGELNSLVGQAIEEVWEEWELNGDV